MVHGFPDCAVLAPLFVLHKRSFLSANDLQSPKSTSPLLLLLAGCTVFCFLILDLEMCLLTSYTNSNPQTHVLLKSPLTNRPWKALKDPCASGALCVSAPTTFPNSVYALPSLQAVPYWSWLLESTTLCTLPSPHYPLAIWLQSPVLLENCPSKLASFSKLHNLGIFTGTFWRHLARRVRRPVRKRVLIWLCSYISCCFVYFAECLQISSPIFYSSGPCLTPALVAREVHVGPVFKTPFLAHQQSGGADL